MEEQFHNFHGHLPPAEENCAFQQYCLHSSIALLTGSQFFTSPPDAIVQKGEGELWSDSLQMLPSGGKRQLNSLTCHYNIKVYKKVRYISYIELIFHISDYLIAQVGLFWMYYMQFSIDSIDMIKF